MHEKSLLEKLLQKFTWDASADAKAARAIAGEMNAETRRRIARACQRVADAVANNNRLVLDVGCGFGVLVPFLTEAGIPAANIHGVDLSPEMIRNAQEHTGSQVRDLWGHFTPNVRLYTQTWFGSGE